jgi:hypothetical protein
MGDTAPEAVMTGPAEDSISAPGAAAQGLDQLRSTAGDLAAGLNLLRWALMLALASVLVMIVGSMLMARTLSPGGTGWAWCELCLSAARWPLWPLAFLGLQRILRARNWGMPRWLVIIMLVYFAALCVWTPLGPVRTFLWRLGVPYGGIPLPGPLGMVIGSVLSLAYFVVLFGAYHLAGAVDAFFDGSLISARRRRWLLWPGVVLHGLGVIWWLLWVWLTYDESSPLYGSPEWQVDVRFILLTAQRLMVGLPFFAWLVWLLVEAFRVGRKLKHFVKLNRCPRCGYDLRERIAEGCPECGWGRGPARGVP